MNRRRSRALVLALTLVTTPLLALAVGAAPAGSAAEPAPLPVAGPNDDAPAQVVITKLAPRAPMPADAFFQVAGTITNRGSQPLHELKVRLRRGQVLQSRSQLDLADTEPPATGLRIGAPIAAATADLPPGASTTFDLRLRVELLDFGHYESSLGVYPVKLEVRARFGDSGSIGAVGNAQTYVPWFPDGPPRGHLRIAWLWPLVDQPRRGPREVMVDDVLADQFVPQGRLGRLLRAAADGQKGKCDDRAAPPPDAPVDRRQRPAPCRRDPVPVTYAVDPDLLFTADAMQTPYQVRVTEDRNRKVVITTPARRWLDQLRAAVADQDVLALPYGDPDVVALSPYQSGLADEVGQLRELGRREAARITGRAPLTTVIWPPGGRVTRRGLETLASGGATAAVLDAAALPAAHPDRFPTPDAHGGQLPTQTGQTLNGLVLDPVLSQLLGPGPTGSPGPRLVEQRWLAETAIIAAEAPSLSRTLLVAPPRRADLVASVASAAIADTGRLPWLCGVSVAAVAVGSEQCAGEIATPPRPAATRAPAELEPPRAEDLMLRPGYLAGISQARRDAGQFTDEVLDPNSTEAVVTTARLLRARARTESSAWRSDPGAGDRMLALLQDDLADLRGKVHLQIGRGVVTLTSSTGVISVNVVNELGQPVRVGVRLRSAKARLSTGQVPVETILPGRAKQINLRVTSATSGKFFVRAQLVDRNEQAFAAPVDLVVRSTQYGRVALAVTGIGAGVLLVAAGIRITRRALRRERTT